MYKLERRIFLIYIILLPVTSVTTPLGDKLYSLANSLSFFPHILGLILLLLNYKNTKKISSKFLVYTMNFIIVLNMSSLFMALLLNVELGIWIGRSTIKAVFPQIIYYIQILSCIVYNVYGFNKFGIETVKKGLEIIVWYMLGIGLLQIIIINTDLFILESLYAKSAKILGASNYVMKYNRVCLLGTEASVAGVFIAIISMPYLLSKIIDKVRVKYIILILLYLIVIYFTKSSSAYWGAIINMIGFIYFKLKNMSNLKIIIGFIGLSSIILSGILFSSIIENNANKNDSKFVRSIKGITFEKLVDTNNYSTLHRNTSVYTDVKAFMEHPILGVGNGNQGFYYIKHFPDFGYRSPESIDYYTGKSGWPGAGAFLPTFISGYGILGIILLVIFLRKSFRHIKQLKGTELDFFYILGIMGMGISGLISIDIVGNYYIVFIISIPFLGEYITKRGKLDEDILSR